MAFGEHALLEMWFLLATPAILVLSLVISLILLDSGFFILFVAGAFVQVILIAVLFFSPGIRHTGLTPFLSGLLLGGYLALPFPVTLAIVRGESVLESPLVLVTGIIGGVLAGIFSYAYFYAVPGAHVFSIAGVAALIGFAIGFAFFFLRLPLFLVESVVQVLLYQFELLAKIPTLRFAPVLHHELSYFPHPLLYRHLALAAEQNPELVRRALDACSVSLGQRGVGSKALKTLQVQELERVARDRLFSPIAELRGNWLPGLEGADSLLRGFAETARYLASGLDASIPYHRLKKFEKAAEELQSLRNRLGRATGPFAKALQLRPLPVWQAVLNDLLDKAKPAAGSQLPNPFRPGQPLSPDQGREVFRGREELVHTIEDLLGEPGRGCSIALLGPRRCGKTSLLKMLPALMPDALCVFFDLQDNPIDSPAAFFSALSRRANQEARRHNLELAQLDDRVRIATGARWIEALDSLPGDLRVLLCIDEFERLESLFSGSRKQLLQLMGVIRATIQHRQRVRVLVAGAAPFEELDSLWNDHFINARELRVGHFDRDTARELLCHPISEFPEDAVPREVAEAIVEQSGGQPNLVHLYGWELVTLLNREKRKQAKLEDVSIIEEDVMVSEGSYFRYIINETGLSDLPVLAVLVALAHGDKPTFDAATRRWLRRRCLITEDDRLSIPVLGRWIQEKAI